MFADMQGHVHSVRTSEAVPNEGDAYCGILKPSENQQASNGDIPLHFEKKKEFCNGMHL
jgi:hypothetical protein